jgi:hypothetical protein
MCGLDNPRGLAFSQSDLYVAEAGRGGLGLLVQQCFTGQAGGTRCYGANGAISRLSNGAQERIATGFPSHANLQGRQAIGPNDVAVFSATGAGLEPGDVDASVECSGGCTYVAIGLQQPPVYRDTYPFLTNFAKLARVTASGSWRYVADLGTYETGSDPDQVFYSPPKLDSNPYALLQEPGGRSVLVADAGGNSILRVDASGGASGQADFEISTRAVLAPHPTSTDDAVPTSVAVGPDGAHYVGELTGFPLIAGEANVLRIAHSSESPVVCLSGFTQIMDLAFDRTGDLYVLGFQGSLTRVTPDRSIRPAGTAEGDICARYAAGVRTVIVSGLTNPTSVAIGPDGAAYVSNRGTFPATGQVIRIRQ